MTDLASVAEEGGYDLVINCTGVWAGRLAGDDKVKPLRGQVRGRTKTNRFSHSCFFKKNKITFA